MTNLGYCLSLSKKDISLVNRVVQTVIEKRVGVDAPIWDKEKVYDQWCSEPFDQEAWDRTKFEMNMTDLEHVKAVENRFGIADLLATS